MTIEDSSYNFEGSIGLITKDDKRRTAIEALIKRDKCYGLGKIKKSKRTKRE